MIGVGTFLRLLYVLFMSYLSLAYVLSMCYLCVYCQKILTHPSFLSIKIGSRYKCFIILNVYEALYITNYSSVYFEQDCSTPLSLSIANFVLPVCYCVLVHLYRPPVCSWYTYTNIYIK